MEFVTDKIPGVDSAWDLLQTLARVPAGAFLAAATLSPDGDLGTGTLLAGAGVALASHGLKSGTRALLNTSPEPASNWIASAAEDTVVVGGLALAYFLTMSTVALAIGMEEKVHWSRVIQVGGPLGSYLPSDRFDLPMDYEAFAAADALLRPLAATEPADHELAVLAARARVIAEGVEQLEELQLLERMGVDLVQGYLIGRPLPTMQIAEATHQFVFGYIRFAHFAAGHPLSVRRIGAPQRHQQIAPRQSGQPGPRRARVCGWQSPCPSVSWPRSGWRPARSSRRHPQTAL